ncbi:MAG: shikimate dehydrogenase [Acidobacteriota bacterium]|nr:shikimate dehydrogenase [Acidobacteriota bacterium]
MTVAPMNYAARSLRLRIPRICVSLTGSEPAELFDQAEAVLRENTLIELRLDYLKSPLAAIPKIRRIIEIRPDAILIATCRRTVSGGNFKGSLKDELDVLQRAADAGAPALDVSIESAEGLTQANWEDLRARAAIILSSHDFKSTNNLEETFARMRAFPADFYKVVGTATSLHDNVTMTRFLEQYCSEYPMVGMCMGELGMVSRILAIKAGAAFTFSSPEAGKETAPGQPTFRELRDFYRIEQVDAITKIYGIVGDPVAHSMSPTVHNVAFRRENVNAVYVPLRTKKLDDLLSTVRDLPLDGISVTMPHKQAIVEHLDNSDVLTQRTGACNTVVRGKDGRLFGFNTDVYGIVAAIEPRVNLKEARVLVLGAGGAARAAVFGLRAKGAEVSILNRTPANAQALAKQAGAKVIKRTDLPKLTFDVIFNATPVGMAGDKHTPLEENELNAVWVFDSVYNPIETKLIKMAQAKGLGTIVGSEMFVNQAARQFEIWTGKPAPLDSMRQVLMRALGAVSPETGSPISTVVQPKAKVLASASAAAEASEAAAPEAAEKPAASAKPEAKHHEAKSAAKKAVAKAVVAKPAAKPAAKAAPKPEAKPVKAAAKKSAPKPVAKKVAAKPKPEAKKAVPKKKK